MTNATKFDDIRPFHDSEVQSALQSISAHPMMHAIMNFTFPDKTEREWVQMLHNIHSTQQFQAEIVANALQRILKESCVDGMTYSGFETLEADTSYLFISNHRDILLDTSLLNLTLYYHNLLLTASAIGDNLLKNPFLYTLSKINRNFIVRRGLSPRELLQSSILMSEYIQHLLKNDNRTVWIAQREGRTKDGLDETHAGVLKMIAMAAPTKNVAEYFKTLRIVPVSISYEYDPTDSLKIPELLAKLNNAPYVKEENEDFNSLYKGLMGQKKRIHIHAGTVLNAELDHISDIPNANQQIKAIAQLIDNQIVGNYKIWATNYIALDIMNGTNQHSAEYTLSEKDNFINRMAARINMQDPQSVERFLAMYANPILNKKKVLESVMSDVA
jgi:1-acyl-sn-glycerol-3-phosphate acyltransferase